MNHSYLYRLFIPGIDSSSSCMYVRILQIFIVCRLCLITPVLKWVRTSQLKTTWTLPRKLSWHDRLFE